MLGSSANFLVGFRLGIIDGTWLGEVIVVGTPLGTSVVSRGALGSEDGIMLGALENFWVGFALGIFDGA
jgi:hypothetical protein